MIRGMIFDFDGTLMDSMSVWESAGAIYLRSLGKEAHKELPQILKPLSLFESACYIKEQYGIPLTAEKIMDGINRTVEEFYFSTAQPKPGVPQWLEELSARNIGMCIATATDRYLVEAALKRCGMRRYFSDILTCTEVGSGKDKPAVFIRAMERLGTPLHNTAVAEDSFHALCTAKAAGFMTVAVYDQYEPRQTQLRDTADVYLTDCRELGSFWKFASAP